MVTSDKGFFTFYGYSNAMLPLGMNDPTVIAYMVNNNVRWNASIGTNGFTETSVADNIIENYLDALLNAGVEVYLQIETPMADDPYSPIQLIPGVIDGGSEPESVYDSSFGDCLAIYESDDRLAGYTTEAAYDTGINWLRNNIANDRKICQNSSIGATPPPLHDDSPRLNVYHSWEWRMSMVDQFNAEIYTVYNATTTSTSGGHAEYQKANFPDLPFGITTYAQYAGTTTSWWADIQFYEPMLPYHTQQLRMLEYLPPIKEAAGGTIDYAETMVDWWDLYATVFVEGDYLSALNLTNTLEPFVKSPQDMSQSGLQPYYSGASVCGHTTPPPDTFVNTGNELILLKNVDYGDDCHVHEITVSGSDYGENYTIAVSPDMGVLLGPFPTALFGTLPEIIYDNTNLYITIVKDVPYSPIQE